MYSVIFVISTLIYEFIYIYIYLFIYLFFPLIRRVQYQAGIKEEKNKEKKQAVIEEERKRWKDNFDEYFQFIFKKKWEIY